jgi:transcriptional regulator with XRE-family HTH domain
MMTLIQMNIFMRQWTQKRINEGKLSVKVLSMRSGLSQAHVSNWLHGKRDCSLFALSSLLVVIGLVVELVPASAARDRRSL